MYHTSEQIIKVCNEKNIKIGNIVLEEEYKKFGRDKDTIIKQLNEFIDVMEDSATKNLDKETKFGANTINGFAKRQYEYSQSGNTITGEKINKTIAMAFSTFETNSSMGKIIATPTAGSSGILPAAVMFAKEEFGSSREEIIDGVLTAVGVGQVIGMYATFSGAEGGCQAETGSAAAMAAAMLVQLKGGSVEEILEAASISLVDVLGLVCDPIGGLVEYPCTFRNALGIVNAMISADMALAGAKSIVPFEEVCQAMSSVGKSLHVDLKETGYGGLANTKTGNRIREEYFGKHSVGKKNK